MTADGWCVWLYAVTDADAEFAAGDLTGVSGERVRPVQAAEFTAIVSDVAEPEFGEAALRRNLEDLHWLEKTAREHHGVIEALASRGPVVPMRLATVYDSDAGLASTLEERAADLQRALSRVRACREWGVRGYVTEPAAGDTGPGEGGPADGQAAGPGAAYLQRRRTQLNARENLRREAMSSAQAIYAELSHHSAAARMYPPQSPELSGQAASMVLNAAYLVTDDGTREFKAAITALTDRYRSLQLVVTGPWPAYSFVAEADARDTQ